MGESPNAALIRRQIAALNRDDEEEALTGLAQDVEWVVAREHPASRTLCGRSELSAYRRDWVATLGSLHLEIDELFDHGDVIVVIGRIEGIGKESGAEVAVPIGFVTRFRDGLVVRVEEYLDPLEALRRA